MSGYRKWSLGKTAIYSARVNSRISWLKQYKKTSVTSLNSQRTIYMYVNVIKTQWKCKIKKNGTLCKIGSAGKYALTLYQLLIVVVELSFSWGNEQVPVVFFAKKYCHCRQQVKAQRSHLIAIIKDWQYLGKVKPFVKSPTIRGSMGEWDLID